MRDEAWRPSSIEGQCEWEAVGTVEVLVLHRQPPLDVSLLVHPQGSDPLQKVA